VLAALCREPGLEPVCGVDAKVTGEHLSLPDGYGLEVVRQVRAVTTAPIVVLTGSVDETLAARALTEGAQSYLPKGFIEPAELLAAMETAGAALAPRLSVGANPGVPE